MLLIMDIFAALTDADEIGNPRTLLIEVSHAITLRRGVSTATGMLRQERNHGFHILS